MSYYDYRASSDPALSSAPFYALLMAAMRQADTPNTEKFKAAWPDVWQELYDRYNAPGGLLPGENFEARSGGANR
jgi:hypothetical protein